MSISISPRNPQPNSVVTARIKSFSADLQQEVVVWTVNGSEQASGIGIVEQEIAVGKEGSTTTIKVSVVLSNSNIKTETIIVRPGTVSLSWEAETTVPAWYQGARLPSPGSLIRVKAFPELRFGSGALDPKTLTYSWSLDGRPMRNVSGVNKSLFEFNAANLSSRNHTVSVLASSPSGQVRGSTSVLIPIFNPEIHFYKSRPLLGTIFNRSLGNSDVVSSDTNIAAAPFFFSQSEENLVEYEWHVGANKLDDSFQNVRTIILNAQGEEFRETISVVAHHATNIFQNAKKTIRISIQN